MNIELKINSKLFNPSYFPLIYNYSKRYEVYYGGAGSGKSHFVFQKVVIKALNRKRKVLVVRKTAKSNKNSTFQMTLDTLSTFHLLDCCKVNRTDFTITLPNESVILFYGCDDVEKIKSIAGITDIVCEECTELTLDDVSQLDLRLRANVIDLQMYFMFNPVSKANWVYQRWFAPEAIINTATTIITQTTYRDNKFLPQEYIDTLESMMVTNPAYYKIYALGEFGSLDNLVFQNWKEERFAHAAIKGQMLIGLDFGFVNDTSALVASLLDEESKTIYIFQEWGDTNKTNDEIAAIISSLGFSKSKIVADCAERKSIEEIRRSGIPHISACAKGPDSILHGIQKLQQYEIIVHPDCKNVITEFQNYSWQKDKQSNEYINKPIDKFNHYIDALRYSLQCVEGDRRLRTMNKALLGL